MPVEREPGKTRIQQIVYTLSIILPGGATNISYGEHHYHSIPEKNFGEETVTTVRWPAEQQPQPLRINIEPEISIYYENSAKFS